MGMVRAAQKGEKPASKTVAKVAKKMDKDDVEDYLQDILGNEPVTCDCQE